MIVTKHNPHSHTQPMGMEPSNPTQSSSQRKCFSVAWQYFDIKFVSSKNQDRVVCKYCSKDYICNGSGIGDLLRHIISCPNMQSDLVA